MTAHRYSEALRRVAPHLAQHARGGDLLRYLATDERNREPDPDGWATAEAVYWFGVDWHAGCPLYAAQCATGYRPGRAHRGASSEDVAAMASDLAAIANGDVRCRYCGNPDEAGDCGCADDGGAS